MSGAFCVAYVYSVVCTQPRQEKRRKAAVWTREDECCILKLSIGPVPGDRVAPPAGPLSTSGGKNGGRRSHGVWPSRGRASGYAVRFSLQAARRAAAYAREKEKGGEAGTGAPRPVAAVSQAGWPLLRGRRTTEDFPSRVSRGEGALAPPTVGTLYADRGAGVQLTRLELGWLLRSSDTARTHRRQPTRRRSWCRSLDGHHALSSPSATGPVCSHPRQERLNKFVRPAAHVGAGAVVRAGGGCGQCCACACSKHLDKHLDGGHPDE